MLKANATLAAIKERIEKESVKMDAGNQHKDGTKNHRTFFHEHITPSQSISISKYDLVCVGTTFLDRG